MFQIHQPIEIKDVEYQPHWQQRLLSCPFCSGYTANLRDNRAGRRLSCGHWKVDSDPSGLSSRRGNMAFTAIARIDPPVVSMALVEAPIAKAGFPSPAADYIEDGIDLNSLMVANPAATFFVRVSGDSMIDAGIFENDVVAVDRSLTPSERNIVVAVFEGAFYIKRLRRINQQLALCSENSARQREYPPMFLADDPEHIVWGVVTGAVRKF